MAGTTTSGGGLRDVAVVSYASVAHSHVEESVLMDGVDVGRYARLRKVIVDKGVKIPPRVEIGFDPEYDRKRFHVSEGGVVVLPKGVEVPPP